MPDASGVLFVAAASKDKSRICSPVPKENNPLPLLLVICKPFRSVKTILLALQLHASRVSQNSINQKSPSSGNLAFPAEQQQSSSAPYPEPDRARNEQPHGVTTDTPAGS